MKTLHVKSPCCQEKIYHFGNRRRQCSLCKKTWSIRQKKKGRKRYRISKILLNKIFTEGQSLRSRLRKNYPSLNALHKRFHRTLVHLSKQPKKINFPRGKLILIGDGLWFNFKGRDWVLYVTAIKSVKDNRAIILDPVLLPDKENYSAWKTVLETIPKSVRKRIKVFVSDNFKGSAKLCNELRWIHQLCHFHLLARLQVRRGRIKINLPNRKFREKIYQNIRLALETKNYKELQLIRRRLKRWANHSNCPQKMGSITREFLREINCYRACLDYPELNLPTTTNSIESLNRKIRNKTAKLNNPEDVELWSTVLIRFNPTIICNGKNFQQN